MNHMPIEQSITQVERWIESIHQERDFHALSLDGPLLRPVERAFVEERLKALDRELSDARGLLAQLQRIRHRPELILSVRPHRQLKVALRHHSRVRKEA